MDKGLTKNKYRLFMAAVRMKRAECNKQSVTNGTQGQDLTKHKYRWTERVWVWVGSA